jgi:hypothetical protein
MTAGTEFRNINQFAKPQNGMRPIERVEAPGKADALEINREAVAVF